MKSKKNEDKHDQFILSYCRVSAFTKVISAFSLEQQAIIKEIGFRSILDLRCGWQQYDTNMLRIVFHDREFCLNITTFSIIMMIKDGGELVDIEKNR